MDSKKSVVKGIFFLESPNDHQKSACILNCMVCLNVDLTIIDPGPGKSIQFKFVRQPTLLDIVEWSLCIVLLSSELTIFTSNQCSNQLNIRKLVQWKQALHFFS